MGVLSPRRVRKCLQRRDIRVLAEPASPVLASHVDLFSPLTSSGLGPLDAVLSDPTVSELMVHAGAVWVERGGILHRCDISLGEVAVRRLIDRLVGPAGARVDRASPLLDVRLPDGSRACIVLPPIAVDGPVVTVRRFILHRATLADFAAPPTAEVLRGAVAERANVVIAGGTGTGKTTLLNALATLIPTGERIVTIEDTAELRIDHPHVVRLQARTANAEGIGEVDIRRLVRAALRLRPDRIIVGEARGPEVLDVAQAMNTGHQGTLSTCHANSPLDALRRLEAMAMLGDSGLSHRFVREQLRAGVHIIVQLRRTADGRREVADVVEVTTETDWSTGSGLVPLVRDGCPVAQRARQCVS